MKRTRTTTSESDDNDNNKKNGDRHVKRVLLSPPQQECIQQLATYCSEQFSTNFSGGDDSTSGYGLFLNSLLEEIVKTKEYDQLLNTTTTSRHGKNRSSSSRTGISHRLKLLMSGECFTLLPTEIVEHEIFAFLDPIDDLLRHRPDTVCSLWYHNIDKSGTIWSRIAKALAPQMQTEKYDKQSLKEYCLAIMRAFYGQKRNGLSYCSVKIEKEYDPSEEVENINSRDEATVEDGVFLVGGEGHCYDDTLGDTTYLSMKFSNVKGYFFSPVAPFYVCFSYNAKYEYQGIESTFECQMIVNDGEEKDGKDKYHPIDDDKLNEVEVNEVEVKKILKLLNIETDDIKKWFMYQFFNRVMPYVVSEYVSDLSVLFNK